MAHGSVEKRVAKGDMVSWRARIDTGRDQLTGKRTFESSTFRTQKAAQSWLRRIGNRIDEGTFTRPSAELLEGYLTHWLATRSDLAPATRIRYDAVIRVHIVPALGTVALGKLTGRHIQQLYNRHAGTSQPRLMRTILRQSLDQAIAEGLIPRNPSIGLKARGTDRVPGDQLVWDAEQLVTFLHVATISRHAVLFRTLAVTGLRISEALGLCWRDVDLTERVITVSGRAKTRTSRRPVTIDVDTAARLATHRSEQRARLHNRDILVTTGTPVFDRGDGEPINRAVIEYQMQQLVERAALPRLTPHGLRHTHASLLLQAGRPLHYVQRRLGHASASTTLHYYAHVLPGTEHVEADVFGELLRVAAEAKSGGFAGSGARGVPTAEREG